MNRFLLGCLAILLPLCLLQAQRTADQFQQDWDNYVRTESAKPPSAEVLRLLQETEGDLGRQLSADERHLLTEEYHRFGYLEGREDEYNLLFQTQDIPYRCDDVCYNGGFERGFTCFRQAIGSYNSSIFGCDYQGAWMSPAPGTNNRFEIVGVGSDQEVPALDRVRFGGRAAKLNSFLGHGSDDCDWADRGIDRLSRRFRITEDTRDFTIWYAFVLENPAGHTNQQPFFSISLSYGGLEQIPVCFDGNDPFLQDASMSNQCEDNGNDIRKWRDWSCLNLSIPERYLGQWATLSITVADCGQGAHAGWGYVDGICESCEGSTDGSITVEQPERCATEVCGSYTLPTGGDGDWTLPSIDIAGATGLNLTIDTANQTFCFTLLAQDFLDGPCIDITATANFTNGTDVFAQTSNTITFCRSRDCPPLCALEVDLRNSRCDDNGTPDYISDDTYSISVSVAGTNGMGWRIIRLLADGTPGPLLQTGTGDAGVNLGPFLIQDGSWTIRIEIPRMPGCYLDLPVTPPPFCSGCHRVRIANIQCINGGTADPNDDQWTFDILIDGNPASYWIIGSPINEAGPYGIWKTIYMGSISGYSGPVTFTIVDARDERCQTKVTVTPPKSCSRDCELRPSVRTQPCVFDERLGSYVYYIDVNVSGTDGQCWMAKRKNADGSEQLLGSYTGDQWVTLGPFQPGEGWTLWLFICDQFDCVQDYYITSPRDCGERLESNRDDLSTTPAGPGDGLTVYPNPVGNGAPITLVSRSVMREVRLTDGQGRLLRTLRPGTKRTSIDGTDIPAGVYYLIVTAPDGQRTIATFVRF